MSYIHFDKTQLINLKFSLDRELLRTNRAGSYASTTIITTNTRKYHGLLVAPQPLIDDDNHVLLSSIDETVIDNNFEFHTSMRMYPGGIYEPKGHKYLREFFSDPNPKLVYRMGNIVFTKEYIFAMNEDRIFIKYKLEESVNTVTFRLKPFLAYRNVHSLVKANTWVDTKYKEVKNGISWQMYKGYSKVTMQFSKPAVYTHVPDWYYNIQYIRELERGYESTEDLYVPGYFDVKLKKGESIVISVALEEKNPETLTSQWASEVKKRTPRDSFENCLTNAGDEFIIKYNKKTEVVAGYPWFGRWGRDTFIALPGLTLPQKDYKQFKSVTDTLINELSDGLFPNVGHGKDVSFHSVDTSLWFFWAIQQQSIRQQKKAIIWKDYGTVIKDILRHLKQGTHFNIKIHENGLVWAGEPGQALTWMDAIVSGKPVTPRTGYAVEVNALWYNALMFSLELAEAAEDNDFIAEWGSLPELVQTSFIDTFWSNEKGYLADFATKESKNWDVRPNMIFAVSMHYSPLNNQMAKSIVNIVKNDLLTTRGLRSLSPKSNDYKGEYRGNPNNRDMAYHQGSVWAWLAGAFAEAYLKVYGKSGIETIENLYRGFEEVMSEAGIGTISEVYDGDPPHKAAGAISQAWSVAEILRIKFMLDQLNESN
jgi:predicted glycogen debranching enzyme